MVSTLVLLTVGPPPPLTRNSNGLFGSAAGPVTVQTSRPLQLVVHIPPPQSRLNELIRKIASGWSAGSVMLAGWRVSTSVPPTLNPVSSQALKLLPLYTASLGIRNTWVPRKWLPPQLPVVPPN